MQRIVFYLGTQGRVLSPLQILVRLLHHRNLMSSGKLLPCATSSVLKGHDRGMLQALLTTGGEFC